MAEELIPVYADVPIDDTAEPEDADIEHGATEEEVLAAVTASEGEN